jgi:aminopeptidase N
MEIDPVAGVRNLTQTEAAERARLLTVTEYDVSLDLTDGTGGPGEQAFRSTTEVRFTCREPGESTFIEVAANRIRRAVLNGVELDTSGWSAEKGLTLPDLAAENTLLVDADFPYSADGQGLHRSVDPVDKEVYLYSQFETADAQRAFACFDQPDLKAVFTWHATVPAHWKVVSNAVVERVEPGDVEASSVVHFARSVPMSTYVTALCAGPYHEVREVHDGIDMGVFCRASMAAHLDAEDLFLVTRQGLDFFNEQFGLRYPLPKYDQLWVPEFNAGAMENFGAVVHAEQHYLFRSQVTDYEYEQRANTILHEMAHMWFGDLVTMRWWDDLWLNESFAEWASHWCNTEATRYRDAWTTFLILRKNWGYRQDQFSSTHPVYCEIPDVDAVEVNFDGITYAKGASVIKQLVAYVGIDAFVAGLRAYFAAHAWGNATFDDLLAALEQASGRPLRTFASEWLETSQVNTLRPIVEIGPDGRYTAVSVAQEAPASHPHLRTHRIGVGIYDLAQDRLVRRDRLELDVAGTLTPIPALTGVQAADVLLLNEDDLTYAKLRLDDRSLATVVDHISGLESSLSRALCWTAAYDQMRDAELRTRDYTALVCSGLPRETDINLVTAALRYLQQALGQLADPAWAPTGWQIVADTARATFAEAEPGSGLQLAWARTFISSARQPADLAVLRNWLDGIDIPAGLKIDTELRWALVHALVANGSATSADIDGELDRDRTASGERSAAQAQALWPSAESKAEIWRRLTGGERLPNWLQRAFLMGFHHPFQVELTRPYVGRFFDVLDDVWANSASEPAQEFVYFGYPGLHVSQETIDITDAWLAGEGHVAPLRRLVVEGKDGVLRALAARAKDASPR